MTYVSPPRPIDVKKLMAKRVLRGLSLGNRPSKDTAKNLQQFKTHDSHMESHVTYGSLSLSFSFCKPMYSANSWNIILTNIRLKQKVDVQVTIT